MSEHDPTSSIRPPATGRRAFLRSAAAIAAAAPALAAAAATSRATAGPVEPPPLDRLRDHFRFSESAVPMNAANLCPASEPVRATLERYTTRVDEDCSFQSRSVFGPLAETARTRIATQLRVSPDEVALVRNTSEGNNTVNAGLALKRGDEVLLWDQNHPTNLVAWKVRAARYGLRVKVVSVPNDPADEDALVAPFEAALSRRTRVLAFSHVSNVSGIALPAARLTAIARARGIHVHLDGAQTWGAQDVDLAAIDCDSYAASGHKWFMGPREVGLLVVRERAIERVWPAVVAPGWGDDADPDPVGARKFESLGQRDDAALAALGTAAELLDHYGMPAVEVRVRWLAQRLKAGLAAAGVPLVTPLAPALSGGVCIAAVSRDQRRTVFDRLYREHGIACAPTGGVRLCPHVYNTTEHVDRAVAGVVAVMQDLGLV